MSSTQKSKKQVSPSKNDYDDPDYGELVEYLDKSATLITHYSNENYDLKQEIEVHKKVKSVMQNDFIDLQKKVMFLEENSNKVKERGRGLKNILQSIGNSTTEEYKQKSKHLYDKMAKDELENWNRIKNSIN